MHTSSHPIGNTRKQSKHLADSHVKLSHLLYVNGGNVGWGNLRGRRIR